MYLYILMCLFIYLFVCIKLDEKRWIGRTIARHTYRYTEIYRHARIWI